MTSKSILLERIRTGEELGSRDRLSLIAKLSVPSMLSQLSYIIMVYIDAAMVGRLGAAPSAAVGLMSTSTWLFGSLLYSAAMGFSEQVAHLLGANKPEKARETLRQSIPAVLLFSLAVAAIGIVLAPILPRALGAPVEILPMAAKYFLIFAISIPIMQLSRLSNLMLYSAGNMRVPSIMSVVMCVLDIICNFLLIFPTRQIGPVTIPGAGLGVAGAALGTAIAMTITAAITTIYLFTKEQELAIAKEKGSFRPERGTLKKAFKISLPVGVEHTVMCGAQIVLTAIVAPLGNAAIAANAFAVTAESLCYMPGVGIGDSATTLVGQSYGAKRPALVRQFATQAVWVGIAVMTLMGVIMYFAAPLLMGIMTPVEEIKTLGTTILKIEAFAEPMYAASLVAYAAFIGTGDTLLPACMNFFSIWVVRLTLAAFLAPRFGLVGVWIAMAIELCFRGAIFLVRLYKSKWANK